MVKTSVERVDDTTVKLAITVGADQVEEAIDAVARRLSSEVKVPGFRPGRVPRRVLESRLGKDALRQEAVRDALPGFYAEAVRAEGLPVVGAPEFDVDTFEHGRDAVFTATVEVRPDVEVPDYSELRIPHPDWEVSDEEVREQLDELRERFAELKTVRRRADVGDYVVVTINAERGGQRLEEASGDDLLYEIGDAEQTEAELDRQLAGVEAGAILKFSDTLGEDYGELAGERATFTAIVKEVKVKQLPALDDDFAVDASEFDTIEELKTALRREMGRAKLEQARAELRGKVIEAVAELTDVPLPPSLVQEELRFRLDRLGREAQAHGMSPEEYLQAAGVSSDELYRRMEEDSERTIKAQLLLDAIGREAGIEVGRDDLSVEIALQAQRLGRSQQEITQLLAEPSRINALASDAFRRKVIDHLIDTIEILSAPPQEVLDELAAGDDEAPGEAAAAEASAQAAEASAQAAEAAAADPASGPGPSAVADVDVSADEPARD